VTERPAEIFAFEPVGTIKTGDAGRRSGAQTWILTVDALGSTKQAALRRFARGPMSERFAELWNRLDRPSGSVLPRKATRAAQARGYFQR
jgi:hypothetical protein